MRFGIPVSIALVAAGSGWSAPALASDYGCQVLLCLSNPGGPTQYGACVPPIYKLWRDLATGKAFPPCLGGGVSKTTIHGKQGSANYRVEMTFSDGRQQTYSLAAIDGIAAMRGGDASAPQGARQQ
ncbi:hypothetical protein [Sphingomonas sp. CARO-RG-8B-R24-01]|uniref:hypothetical protein n=1 Tax=Sphingomonas sp. CARO-RG-8B-R24-01 TaxID=2914831 RepID=UPI001F5ADC45|nr:hypothetical protein [Sphingomonas sp. CARO-RG-8B-R24-01]